jgi:hypothetical protein
MAQRLRDCDKRQRQPSNAAVDWFLERRFPHSPLGPSRMAGLIFCRSIAPHKHARLIPIEVGSHVGAVLAAGRANEARFQIRQPNIIRPSVAADREVVAAPVVAQ